MARLDPLPPATRTWSTRAWLGLVRRVFRRELRLYPILAHAPKVLSNVMLMNVLFERGDWALPVRLRKLVQLRVATVVGCEFCRDLLAAAGRKHGADSALDDRDRAALDYAEMVTVSPSDISDAQFADLRRWFSDREIVELTAQAAFEGFRARLGRSLRIEDEGFAAVDTADLPAIL